jgi:hypothetical protein
MRKVTKRATADPSAWLQDDTFSGDGAHPVIAQQLYGFACLYLILTAAVAVFTRATPRRVVGALAGAAVCGPAAFGIVALGERAGWWRVAINWNPYLLAVLWVNVVLWAFVFLLTWRVARRFGRRGLAVLLVTSAVLGPFRDSWFMARFPEWGSLAAGIAPMLAISAAYVLLGSLGHGVMRLVSGPAAADRLARQPWERA